MIRNLAIVLPCSKSKRPVGAQQARNLYQGGQFRALIRSVDRLRSATRDADIRVYIASAGHGLVAEDQLLEPYDARFSALRAARLRRGLELGLPAAMQRVIAASDLTVTCLSLAYLEASGLPEAAPVDARVLYLGGIDIRPHGRGRVVPAGRAQARALGTSERFVRAVVFDRLVDEVSRQGIAALEGVFASQ